MARTTFSASMTDTWGSKEDIKKARKGLAPDPWDVRTARHKTGLSMQEAGDLVYVSRNTWYNWEREKHDPKHKPMHPAYAELFSLKTGLITIDELCPHLKRLNVKN